MTEGSGQRIVECTASLPTRERKHCCRWLRLFGNGGLTVRFGLTQAPVFRAREGLLKRTLGPDVLACGAATAPERGPPYPWK